MCILLFVVHSSVISATPIRVPQSSCEGSLLGITVEHKKEMPLGGHRGEHLGWQSESSYERKKVGQRKRI